jgi:hypothetical protein
MRTTHSKQTNTSATLHTLATPHTSNQSAPQKLASKMLTNCLLIELYLFGILSNRSASKKIASKMLPICLLIEPYLSGILSKQAAPPKVASKMLPICLLLVFHPTFP